MYGREAFLYVTCTISHPVNPIGTGFGITEKEAFVGVDSSSEHFMIAN